MLNTTILDVAIGMIFIYLLLSLLCSATNELIELLLKKRAADLERGIRELLEPGTHSGTPGLVQSVYNHPLVNGLFPGSYENSGVRTAVGFIKRTSLPSYIPARNFALALMDIIQPGNPGTQSGAAGATSVSSTDPTKKALELSTLRTQLQNVGSPQLQQALTPLIDAAAGDVNRARLNIEEWYNSSMDRVSGWYKRRSHIVLLVLGMVVAATLNADSVIMVRRLASDRALRDSLVASANVYAQEAAKTSATPGATTPDKPISTPCSQVCTDETPQCKLKKTECEIGALGLPIGWASRSDERLNWGAKSVNEHVRDHFFGWMLTALAISLGAPFWFDLLNKFIVIRSTVKPKEKSREEKSKD